MKRIFTLMLIATIGFVACEKKPDNKEEEPKGPPTEVTHGGVTYSVMALEDGTIWMAENLRYVPEGKTPSSDPKDGNGIWYPTKVVDGAVVAATSNEDVAALGYLYDYETAFGAAITNENFKTFEGTQGICPEGWHIPTRAEMLALVGVGNKAEGEAEAPELTAAYWYDAEYKGGKIPTANATGFNFQFAGSIQKNTKDAEGKYATTITKEGTCTIADFLDKPALNMIMTSTGNKYVNPGAANENAQFFGLMSSFTKTYTEGRLTVAFANVAAGYSVRCVWDQKADVTPTPVQ